MKYLPNNCCCGSSVNASRKFNAIDYNFGSTDETAWIMKCSKCRSLYPSIFPTPESLNEAYSNYYTTAKKRNWIHIYLRYLIDSSRMDYMQRSTPKSAAKVLDYGCGSGEYLIYLAGQGFKARLYGTDITQPKSTNRDIYEWLSLQTYDRNNLYYDWITLNHVIEHLSCPIETLVRLHDCCSCNGGLWLSTPNADSFLISAFGEHARDIDFPRHRQIYSIECLMQILSNSGFNGITLPSPRINTLMNYMTCLNNLLSDNSVTRIKKTISIIHSFIGLLLHLAKPAIYRVKDSPEIVVISRRQNA